MRSLPDIISRDEKLFRPNLPGILIKNGHKRSPITRYYFRYNRSNTWLTAQLAVSQSVNCRCDADKTTRI